MKATSRKAASGRRQRQILDAALCCFVEHGWDGTTIEQIRDLSGASHGSIYHFFGSKEALALALYEEGMREYLGLLLAALRRGTTLGEGIRGLVECHLKWTVANESRSVFLTQVGSAVVSEKFAERTAEINDEYIRAVYDWLRPFEERGEIVSLTPELYVSVIAGSASHLARHWLAGRVRIDLTKAAGTLAELALRSLQPPENCTVPANEEPRRC
jgi:AcrR family transcriptional regulator